MKLLAECRDNRTVLRLSGALTAAGASAAQRQLWAALAAAAGDCELDLSGLRRIDAIGLQLLLLARQQALRQGRRLHLGRLGIAVGRSLAPCRPHACFAAATDDGQAA